MDSSIKSLTITGSAAEDAIKSRRGVGRSSSRKKKSEIQESETSTEPIAQNPVSPVRVFRGVEKQAVPVVVQAPPPVVIAPTVVLPTKDSGGDSKVTLNPPKNQKVKLHPKVQSHAPPSNGVTRKSRRIHLVNLSQRFTRAKRVRDETQKQSIDSIRQYLVQKGVIQMKSKAPEKMLRSMYSDFMLLKDPAL